MTSDSQLREIYALVADGERVRMGLLNLLRCSGPGERGAVVTELMMFYRQAFDKVCACLPEPIRPGSAAAAVLLETAHGMATHSVWAQCDSSLAEPEHLQRLADCWHQVTRAVLSE